LKTTLNTLDIIIIVERLKPFLIGSYVTKVYNTDFGILLRVKTQEEKIDLIINHLGWIFKTKYEIKKKEQDQFTKELRNNLKGKRIINITVPFFDRYIVIEFEKGFKLYIEMMHGGNIILTKDDIILSALKIRKEKNRNIIKNEKYVMPEILTYKPLEESISDYYNKVISSKANIAATIIKFFGIPSEIVEEACLLSNINKDTLARNISIEEVKLLDKKIKELCLAYLQNNKSYIISDNNEYISIINLDLNIYNNFNKKIFNDFNEAIEEYFIYLKKKEKEKEIIKEKEKKLFIISDLNKKISELKNQIEILNNFIKLFKEKIVIIDDILLNSYKIIEEKKWDALKEFLSNSWPNDLGMIHKIDLKEKKLNIEFQKNIITLDLLLNSTKNLEILYNLIKEKKEKIKKIEEKIKELESKEKIKEEVKIEIKEKEKKKWYESYLYFYTSNNVLVVAGRDASQNESLIKKRAEENDIILHADIHGSPFTIIKASNTIGIMQDDLFEAAQFTASYSSAWKEGFSNIDVYWVNKSQVSKKAPSGTYLSKGSFMIYGNKNYIKNVPLCLAVVTENNKVKIIPQATAVKKYKEYILLMPGNLTKEDIIEKILNILIRNKKEINKKEARKELTNNLPKGGFSILELHNLS
jgi:predicted ribosome quality control (RQC) complex YloA/Tae2 family protein